ncbi:hypothetical protein CEXT_469551, partial [Caerostris extrusa]
SMSYRATWGTPPEFPGLTVEGRPASGTQYQPGVVTRGDNPPQITEWSMECYHKQAQHSYAPKNAGARHGPAHR